MLEEHDGGGWACHPPTGNLPWPQGVENGRPGWWFSGQCPDPEVNWISSLLPLSLSNSAAKPEPWLPLLGWYPTGHLGTPTRGWCRWRSSWIKCDAPRGSWGCSLSVPQACGPARVGGVSGFVSVVLVLFCFFVLCIFVNTNKFLWFVFLFTFFYFHCFVLFFLWNFVQIFICVGGNVFTSAWARKL